METAGFYAAAGAAGGIAGWAFAAIWRRIAPMSLHGTFWTAMADITRGMLAVEETRDFLRLYRRLGGGLLRYLGRNLTGLALGCAPVIALALVLSPLLFGPWDARAGQARVHPAAAGVLEPRPAQGDTLLRLAGRPEEPIVLPGLPPRAAVCWRTVPCLLLQSLDFSVIRRERPAAAGSGAVVVRPGRAGWNPLFPYLNELELVFFGATVAGAAGGFVAGRPRA